MCHDMHTVAIDLRVLTKVLPELTSLEMFTVYLLKFSANSLIMFALCRTFREKFPHPAMHVCMHSIYIKHYYRSDDPCRKIVIGCRKIRWAEFLGSYFLYIMSRR